MPPAGEWPNDKMAGRKLLWLNMQGLVGIYVCTVILNLQEHETSPHQPSGRSKSSAAFFPRLYLNQESSNECWGKGESWRGESGRDREREKRREGVGRESERERPAFPMGNFNKRQSDFQKL